MTRSSSVVGGWSAAVSRALTAMGYDASELLRHAGIDSSQAAQPDARHTSQHTRELWRLAVEKTGKPEIGLEVARFVGPTTFHALGFSLWASSTLLEALEKMVRYAPLLNEGCGLTLASSEDGTTRFEMKVLTDENGIDLVAPEGVDYFLGAVVKLFRDIAGESFQPMSVFLKHSAGRMPESPENHAAYQAFFRSPVHFDASANALIFPTTTLREKLPTANPELAQQNERIVTEYVARMVKNDTVTQVRSKILEMLPLGEPTHERIAQALYLNPRTMQYRLGQQQATYKSLLDDVRHELAVQYLTLSRYSISEIAYLLGYSDPSHFQRAFRRWKGCSPGKYRASTE